MKKKRKKLPDVIVFTTHSWESTLPADLFVRFQLREDCCGNVPLWMFC